MRLFVALEIPEDVRNGLAALLQELRAISSHEVEKRPRWVRPENLHVTLKFIGEAARVALDGIHEALATVRSPTSVHINFRGLGFFPNEERPRVFWAALVASPNLSSLAGDIDRALATQGIAREIRDFTAHLTLARFEPPGLSEKLRTAILQDMSRDFGSFEASEFHLVESKTKPSGAEYTRLATFPLVTEH